MITLIILLIIDNQEFIRHWSKLTQENQKNRRNFLGTYSIINKEDGGLADWIAVMCNLMSQNTERVGK